MDVNKIIQGDCLEVMRTMPDNSVDSIVTDPPYGLSFMGKHWDYDVPTVEVWRECLRMLKPGGHLLSFAGTRTYHRMAVNIEDAGFEIRDMIAWVYGSGFPKSLDIGKAIQKSQGVELQIVGDNPNHRPKSAKDNTIGDYNPNSPGNAHIKVATTPEAKQWQGWGTALKPALEPICVARKPLIGTVAENVLQYGTGGINVDGGRIGTSKNVPASISRKVPANCYGKYAESGETLGVGGHNPNLGRFPANLIHDGSEEVMAGFPETVSGNLNEGHKQGAGSWGRCGGNFITGNYGGDSGSAARFFKCCKYDEGDIAWHQKQKNDPNVKCAENQSDLCETPIVEEVAEIKTSDLNQEELLATQDFTGNYKECIQPPSRALFAENQENTGITPIIPSHLKSSGCANPAITNSILEIEKSESKRFLYCPKASKEDRDDGCGELPTVERGLMDDDNYQWRDDVPNGRSTAKPRGKNNHPTVKPTDLMRYLCRLVTPPNGLILDPFFGSGSTGKAAKLEYFNYIGIEREPEYCEIAQRRINGTIVNKKLNFGGEDETI